ncbi:efflux RND transporter periplasmic adaptor subunit [Stigmatella sp. ncwal1]|uniref:Efflux RND transporter periplasmic adaptor subunit n=1 Tax=Stigmatella ashevillensis TaxID=2995309 RepID=A0ABT5DLQ8_9BACT|nr:efflux RND transporter periplasmic adaptor subunit [Stigmatella ashevillena]MDC0714599.1 efflux RND transporter periplasmic adaptor subunit [Stigmatella ashevillena]
MSALKKAIFIIGVLALVGAGVYFVRSRAQKPAPGSTLPTIAAERRNLEVVAEASGLLEPIRVVEVKSKASGEVLRVLFETGQRVEQGTLLAEIDPRDVQNALTQAEADLESARVTLSTVTAQRERMEALRASGVVTQQEYETAINSAATARATQVRTQTNLQLARERRLDVTIRAPIGGTILSRSVEPGQIIASATSNVSGGTTLFTMADLSEMQVRAKIDETDIGKIYPGQPTRVTLEAYAGRTFTGNVVKVEPQAVVEQNVTLFPVLIRLKNPEGLLKPGMNAEVAIEIASRRDVVTIPTTSVVEGRQVAATATLLGLDPVAVRAELQPPGGRSRGEGPPAPATPTDGGTTGEATPEGAAADGGTADGGTAPESPRNARQRGNTDTRFGVVFIQDAAGLRARRVSLGLSDWEYTEVVNGLEAGEQVLQVSTAQMQQQQQKDLDRFKQRAGGVIPGSGGGGARGGGPR